MSNADFIIEVREFPSPATVISKVIEVAGDAHASLDKLASVIATDPPLTTELLKTANSAFYGASSAVKTVNRAVVQLGVRTVRCIAVCFAARDAARDGILPKEDMIEFWSDALRRGVAARTLAKLTRQVEPEEAFTTGLLLDFGILAILKKHPEKVSAWREIRGLLPHERLEREKELFGVSHDTIGAMLLEKWGMPASLIEAVTHHHQPETPLARLAAHSERISQLFSSPAPSIALARDALVADLNMPEEQIDQVLNQISGDVSDAAAALGFSARRPASWEDVMSQANRALVSMTLSYEETIAQLKRTLIEKTRLAQELKQANDRLEGLAKVDPLTGLANRRSFEERCYEMMSRLTTDEHAMSILLFDLDHFKKINDTHGHLGGDNVLKAVGKLLSTCSRAEDVSARLGGEEMAVLVYGAGEPQGRAVAERFRSQIETLHPIGPNGPIPVTSSIGGITLRGPIDPAAISDGNFLRSLLHKGDQALYEAKHNGRNRVVWVKGEDKGFWSIFGRR